MTFAAVCCSHSPLMNLPGSAPAAIEAEAGRAFARLRNWIDDFAPDLLVEFGPDHFSGFFYKLLPPFCVGVRAESVGDFRLPAGPLPVPETEAEGLAAALQQAGLDTAISYRMAVDHGFTQVLERLFGGIGRIPVIPIFVNCGPAPRPPFSRVRRLGELVGRYAAALDRRVLFLGSGGLSHDPPLPSLENAPPELQERLIDGVAHSEAYQAARIERLVEATRAFVRGESEALPIAPEWDREFMALMQSGRVEAADAYAGDRLQCRAGLGAHEVRTWVAAFAALAAAGGAYRAGIDYYRPIPEWFGGIGMMHGRPAGTASAG